MTDVGINTGVDELAESPNRVTTISTPENLSMDVNLPSEDCSPDSPLHGVTFSLDGPCLSEFQIYPLQIQTYREMHMVPDFPAHDVSDITELDTLHL